MNESPRFSVSFRPLKIALVALLAVAVDSASAVSGSVPASSKGIRKSDSGGPRTLALAACVNAGISCNTTATGALTNDDCRYSLDQSFYDAWTFEGVAGQAVQITMTAGFDTYLFLYGPDGFLLEDNDDYPGGDTNSRIVYTLKETGTFTIWANSFAPGDTGPYTLELVCTTSGPGSCTAGATTLCLNSGRFRVQVNWRVPSQGTSGVGTAVPLTSDTGYFWFFSANNVELVIKVVDGRAFNNFFWVFYGALSDVEYTINVTDTATGAVKTYTNPQGRLASVADVRAFAGGAATTPASAQSLDPAATERAQEAAAREVSSLLRPASALACTGTATSLCLNAQRFDVRVSWRVPSQGTSGVGMAVPLTSDTGYFWFFSANNVELVIKVVDGRAFNGFFWVFYGALSDVEYTITVTDSNTARVRTYTNQQGNLASVADVAAFP